MEIYDVLKFGLEVVIAAGVAGGTVWKFIRGYVDGKIRRECEERKLADSRIEEKLFDNNEKVHVVMGKIELMDKRIQEHERVRMQEMYELKDSLQRGLHGIQIQLERLRQYNREQDREDES